MAPLPLAVIAAAPPVPTQPARVPGGAVGQAAPAVAVPVLAMPPVVPVPPPFVPLVLPTATQAKGGSKRRRAAAVPQPPSKIARVASAAGGGGDEPAAGGGGDVESDAAGDDYRRGDNRGIVAEDGTVRRMLESLNGESESASENATSDEEQTKDASAEGVKKKKKSAGGGGGGGASAAGGGGAVAAAAAFARLKALQANQNPKMLHSSLNASHRAMLKGVLKDVRHLKFAAADDVDYWQVFKQLMRISSASGPDDFKPAWHAALAIQSVHMEASAAC